MNAFEFPSCLAPVHRMRIAAATAVVILFCGVLATTSDATTFLGDPTSLALLTDNGVVIAGDKRFDQFVYEASEDMPPASEVNVLPILDDNGYLGIRFQGGFVDVPGGNSSIASIKYRVTVLDPRYLITDAHLRSNVNVSGSGAATGEIKILESFAEADNEMDVFAMRNDDGTLVRKTKDWTFFDEGLTELHVEKRIEATGNNGTTAEGVTFPTASFIDQTFSQELIPEPASLALLVGACALLSGFSRRLRARSRAESFPR